MNSSWQFVRIILGVSLFALICTVTYAGGVPGTVYQNNEYNGNPNDTCPGEGTENPIHIGSGNKFHEEVLYQGGGEFPLEFSLYYNSREHDTVYDIPFIYGNWTYSYGQKIEERSDFGNNFVEMIRQDGTSSFFLCKYASGQCSSAIISSAGMVVFGVSGGSVLQKIYSGDSFYYEYSDVSGVVETYNADGMLTKVKNLNGGGTHELVYDLPPIPPVFTDGAEGTITVNHLESGRSLVIKLQLHHFKTKWTSPTMYEGRYYPIEIQTPGQTSITINYGGRIFYCPSGIENCNDGIVFIKSVQSVVWPEGYRKDFGYTEPSLSASLTDINTYESDNSLSVVKSYAYKHSNDSADRGYATSSQHGRNDITLRQYISETSTGHQWTVYNRMGRGASYDKVVENYRAKSKNIVGGAAGNCDGTNVSYTYDYKGNRDVVTNHDTGVVTDYDYILSNDIYSSNLLDEITVKDGTTVIKSVDYGWVLPGEGGFRQLKQVIKDGMTKSYTYEYGRIRAYTETDTTVDPGNYIRQHNRSRTWDYNYTYYGNDADDLHRIQTLIITAPRGITTTYSYNGTGDLTSISNHFGQGTFFSAHNEYSLPQTITDSNGVASTLTYTPSGRLESITTSNAIISFRYNAEGKIARIDSNDGSLLVFGYSDGGRLNRVENQLGDVLEIDKLIANYYERFTLKTFKNSVQKLNVIVDYDALGRYWRMYDLDGVSSLEEVNYDTKNNPDNIIDGNSKNIVQIFDVLDRLDTVEDKRDSARSAHPKVVYGYDSQSRINSITDQEDVVTTYHYDGFGNLLQTSSPNTGVTTYYYDDAGNVINKVEHNNVSTIYRYDLLNRIDSIDYPTQADVDYIYDQQTTNGEVNFGVGRLTAIVKSDGNRIDWIYNLYGNLKKEIRAINGKSYVTQYTYNSANKLASITYPSGYTINYNFNLGVVDSITSNYGVDTTLAYGITFAPFGPLEAFTYGSGLSLNYGLDAHYRIDTLTLSNALSLDYNYDTRGLVDTVTDQASSDRTIDAGYDAYGRLNYVQRNDGVYEYAYDDVGNRTDQYHQKGTADEMHEVYGYEKDLLGNLVNHHLRSISGTGPGAQNRTLGYGQTGSLETDNNRTFTYNDEGRLIKATDSGVTIANYGFNALGQREYKSVGSETRHFTYGLNGELLHEADEKGNWQRDYIYFASQLLAIADKSSAWTGVYGTGSVAPEQFLISNALTVNESDLSDGTSYYAYRSIVGNGSLGASIPSFDASVDGTDIGLEFRESVALNADYVRVSRYAKRSIVLISGDIIVPILLPKQEVVKVAYQNAGQTITQEYDATLYQHFKLDVQNGVVTVWASADGQLWSQLGGDIGMNMPATAVIGFVTQGMVNNSVVNYSDIQVSGGVHDGTQVYYVHNDRLGTPQIITDSNQQVVWDGDIKPFGDTLVRVAAIENNISFPGQYFDSETGLHYNYHRYYDPATGRYITSDPIGLRGGLNTYTYALNNPLYWIDPLGLAVTCTYSQSTGHLVCKDDQSGQTKVDDKQCYAGSKSGGGKNDPNKQDQRDNGPLPRGDWEIGGHDNSKGPLTIDLIPRPGNDVFNTNRDPNSFRVHGDSLQHPGDASQGCIVCGRGTRQTLVNEGGTITVTQ